MRELIKKENIFSYNKIIILEKIVKISAFMREDQIILIYKVCKMISRFYEIKILYENNENINKIIPTDINSKNLIHDIAKAKKENIDLKENNNKEIKKNFINNDINLSLNSNPNSNTNSNKKSEIDNFLNWEIEEKGEF